MLIELFACYLREDTLVYSKKFRLYFKSADPDPQENANAGSDPSEKFGIFLFRKLGK